MLDLSDKRTPLSGLPNSVHDSDSADSAIDPLDMPLVGEMYRHYKGALYTVKGFCTLEETSQLGVLYSPVDPLKAHSTYVRAVSAFNEHVSAANQKRFTHIALADRVAFVEATSNVPTHVLSYVESLCNAPSHMYHNMTYVYDLFDRAKKLDIKLDANQVVAILFHNTAYNPGVAPATNKAGAVGIFNLCREYLPEAAPEIVDTLIGDLLSDKISLPASEWLLDLKYAHLADDPSKFCVYDDLIWMESRHLLDFSDPKKDYDTRRLRFLIEKATDKKIYTHLIQLEESAKANIEGMRKAWWNRYKKA